MANKASCIHLKLATGENRRDLKAQFVTVEGLRQIENRIRDEVDRVGNMFS